MDTAISSAVEFAEEPYQREAWSADIMTRHWQELGHDADDALAPDFAAYQALSDMGRLRIYTVRMESVLIGYAVFLLAPSLFVTGRIQAVANLLWLDRDYRRGWTGYNLMKFANQRLTEAGCFRVTHIVSERDRSLEILLERMGARKQETAWSIRLEGGSRG